MGHDTSPNPYPVGIALAFDPAGLKDRRWRWTIAFDVSANFDDGRQFEFLGSEGETYEPDEDEGVDVVIRRSDGAGDSGRAVPGSVERSSQ